MAQRNEPITLGEILEMTPGDRDSPCWVNGELTARAWSVEIKNTNNGTAFMTCELIDPDNSNQRIQATFFGHKAGPVNGSLVKMSGQGCQLTEYNGKPQITGSAKTRVSVINSPAAKAAQQVGGKAVEPEPPMRKQPLGVTVGMALNNAVALVSKSRETEFPLDEDLRHPEFWREVWRAASQLIRIAHHLEAGRLAPDPSAAAKSEVPVEPPPPRQPPPMENPPAQPAGKVGTDGKPLPRSQEEFENYNPDEDDIPF